MQDKKAQIDGNDDFFRIELEEKSELVRIQFREKEEILRKKFAVESRKLEDDLENLENEVSDLKRLLELADENQQKVKQENENIKGLLRDYKEINRVTVKELEDKFESARKQFSKTEEKLRKEIDEASKNLENYRKITKESQEGADRKSTKPDQKDDKNNGKFVINVMYNQSG